MVILSEAQMQVWENAGWLHLTEFFPDPEILKRWTVELEDLPDQPGRWMRYYETSQMDDRRLPSRIECFLDHHDGWSSLVRQGPLQAVVEQLMGESSVIFKEKINFKHPGGGGFRGHQDAPAFGMFGQTYHISAMISIDDTTTENGCLEMVYGSHRSGLLEAREDGTLSDASIHRLIWTPCPTKAGDVVLFGSHLAHRSGPNPTTGPRRAAYITYNPASEGDHRQAYFEEKRRVFPPEVERVAGRTYSSGPFNIGNPIDG